MNNSAALLLVVLWPLLLACALAYSKSRLLAVHLTPWAAAPALLLALGADDGTFGLSGAMLGGVLHLDFIGRDFLILAATLSLAAGLLARPRILFSAGGSRFALFLLLATAGAIGLVLSGDALLFFTAATLLGYSVYGLLASGSGADAAGRVFIVSLVVSDLVVFELLLVLSHNAGDTSFAALRHTLLLVEYPGTTFALLLIGFGIKIGLIGIHLWLAPVFATATAALRPILISFVFCAGMLGLLRLLPLGEVYWPGAGSLLQWLALATLVYAVPVGVMQEHFRSVLAYGVMALNALFLWLLGAVLAEPALWTGLFTAMHHVLLQAGFALAVLFLLPDRAGGDTGAWLRLSSAVAGWLAALMLVAVPMGMIVTIGAHDPVMSFSLFWLGTALALVTARSLLLKRTAPVTGERALVVVGLSLAALLSAAHSFLAASVGELWQPVLYLLLAALVGRLGAEALGERLPTIPPGDLLGPVERSITAVLYQLNGLAEKQLPRMLDGALGVLHRCCAEVRWREMAERLETMLGRWPIAMLVLVLLGLTVAVWQG